MLIARFLLPHSLHLSGPTFDWTGELEEHRHTVVERAATFTALLRSCRALQNILTPSLYTQIQVGTWLQHTVPSFVMVRPNTSLLLRSLTAAQSLRSNIKTVHLQGMALEEFVDFFELPQIQRITIDGFQEQGLLDLGCRDLAGVSVVKELYLVNCGAKEAPLNQLLSWPRGLEVLFYQVDQESWEGKQSPSFLERTIC